MENLLYDLKVKNPDLLPAEIEGILYILKTSGGIANNELVRETGIPKEVLRTFKQTFSLYLNNSNSDLIQLSAEGTKLLDSLDLQPLQWLSKEYTFDDAILEAFNKVRATFDLNYSTAKREYDQFFATARSSLAKAKLFIEKGLDKESTVATIGDDDLLCVALPLLSSKHKVLNIVEIDRDLVSSIRAINESVGNKAVRLFESDIRLGVPQSLKGSHNVVFIDPPYTRAGVQMFLHRSIELLKDPTKYTGYIFLSFGAGRRNSEKTLKIQEIISSFNLEILDKFNNFTQYNGAETIGSSSSMYVLRTTPYTNITNSILSDVIYTFQENAEEKFPYVDHIVLKVKGVKPQLVESKAQLLKLFGEFCRFHKLKVVDTNITKFKGKGLSLTFILASSNLLVHTWPEHNALHIDLVTCTPIFKKSELGNTIARLFNPENIEITVVE